MSLPAFPDAFFGRAAERALALPALFSRPAVVLTGVGGVGKTRLAAEIAREAGCNDLRRLRWCGLAGARSIVDALAVVLSRLDGPGTPRPEEPDLVGAIGRWLSSRGPLLMVLDDADGVTAELAGLLSRWRLLAPEAGFLVTSRVRPAIPGALLIELDGLPPDEARALFLSRVPALLPQPIDLQQDEVELGRLLSRLDGLPLALELAAARLELLSLDEITRRLDQPLDLLGGRLGPRQRTIRRVLASSWEDLDPAEQAVLAQASVFCGGVPMDAAEAVLQAGQADAGVLDAVQGLVRRSLIRVLPGSPSRLQLYGVVRAFAAEQLGAQTEETRLRHARWFAEAAPAWARALSGPGAAEGRTRLGLEWENLDAARRFGLSLRTAEGSRLALATLLGLNPVARSTRSPEDWKPVLDEVLATAGPEPSPHLALGLAYRAANARSRERIEEALSFQERAVAVVEKAGDRRLEGELVGFLGNLHAIAGHADEARQGYERALQIATEIGDESLEAAALNALARAVDLRERGDSAGARMRLERAIELARRRGDIRAEARFRASRADLLLEQCEPEAAAEDARLAMEIGRRIGHDEVMASGLTILATIGLGQGEQARAEILLEEGIGFARQTGYESVLAEVQCILALALLLGGKPAEAPARAAWAWASGASPTRYAEDRARCLTIFRLVLGWEKGEDPEPVDAFPRIAAALGRARQAGGAGEIVAAALAEAQAFGEERRAWKRLCAQALRHLAQKVEQAGQSWVIASDGAWFAAPGGAAVSLDRRPTLQPLLLLLARARLEHPGEPVERERMLDAAWPGERMLPQAARDRIYTAMSTLRRFGLTILEREGSGYRLDPAAPVRLQPDSRPGVSPSA